MCRKKRYVPPVAYDVKTDDVTVIERREPATNMARQTMGDIFENHSDSEGLNTSGPLSIESSRAQVQPEKVKTKRTAPTAGPPKKQLGTSSGLAGPNTVLGTSTALALPAETQQELKVQPPADGVGEVRVINKEFLTDLLLISQGKKK